jgi:signal transduction histidine kinase
MKKNRIKNRIAVRLLLYFATALLLFTIVVGAIFITLFRAQTIKEHKNDLETRAVAIAEALSDYMASSNADGSHAMSGGKNGSYNIYLRFIDDIAMSDVWVVDEELNLITNGQMSGESYNYADLPTDAEQVVEEVFNGKTTFSEGFSSLLAVPTLTVGTPIEVNGEIVGAVLLHSPVDGIDDATQHGVLILSISILAALVFAVLLSAYLSLSFTKPLNKMKQSALILADGDYTSKTNVQQKDEIGELAGAIDVLSEKLFFAQEQSDRLDQLRADFVSNISHELKTPVTVIRGSLEALCDQVVTNPDQVTSYHQQMLKESIYLERLVNDLLDLSKLQNTDFTMEQERLNLCDILNDATRTAQQLAKEKQLKIRSDFDTRSLTVKGDYGRLRQMFLIVLDNAVKFSPPSGEITISLKGNTVTIRNQGKGIPKTELPHIFDRFYKIASEENRNGSGLGLAIAKQIATRHGIGISVTSTMDVATAFHFDFPK